MEWQEEGVILAARPHGESAAIIEVFTAGHGRQPGVVRGGHSRRIAPLLQPGSQVQARWRARLDSHLGAFTVEPLRSRAALMADRRALAGLNAICALLRAALPERDPHPALWQATVTLLDALGELPEWPALYLRWELGLLDEIGFGLDLSACAVTGATTGLAWVSPRTGRAVSAGAAGPWADRLLPLPACLITGAPPDPAGLAAALDLTGHFLTRGLQAGQPDRPLPEARLRLRALLAAGPG